MSRSNGGSTPPAPDPGNADEVATPSSPGRRPFPHRSPEHRRRRLRRRGRRAYIRSVYFLPSLATLGNAICGFAAMYVAALGPGQSNDQITEFFSAHRFVAACYLIFIAMLFDALDGRLARFTRHTTDFGGQLDSLADVISFGVAPAFLAMQVFKSAHPWVEPLVDRLCWAIGALYMSCAVLRLARFNVSNEHGEQHHFSFLGLPSPGAAAAVIGFILMQQDLQSPLWHASMLGVVHLLSAICLNLLPPLVLVTGLLMISNIRYPHLVNRYLRGRRSLGRLLVVVMMLLVIVVAHRYALGLGALGYAMWGPTSFAWARARRRQKV